MPSPDHPRARVLLPLLLILLIPLCSCRSRSEDAAAARTIVLWEQEDAFVAPFLDGLFAEFRKLPGNEDVRVVRTHFHTEDQRQQFQTASIAGTPPDLLLSPSDPAGIYCIAGFIHPTDALFDMRRFNKPVVEAITLDGKTWGVPMSNGNHLMLFYNRSFVPEAPKSMSELYDLCGRIQQKGAGSADARTVQHCLAFFLNEPFWLAPWLGAFGGWPIDGRTPTLDTPAMRRTLAFILDLKDKRKIVPQECDYNCMDALFKERKAAMIINGDWALSTYETQLGKDFGAARIPRVDETGRWPSPMVSGKYFMLSSKLEGEKLELVRRFVEFMVSEKSQIAQVKALKRLPALSRAAHAKVIMDNPVLRASMDQLLVGKPMPMATEMRAVWDAMRPVYGRTVSGQIAPDAAAALMQKEAAAKIAEMNE
ncbi:MAG: extracellular solute-binding protein [Elusimicrobiota bacterium]|jgi:arabinogalactan oligomer/maltooligosaccharide transport system substrate-binding protein